ncbi:MAG: TlpA disulfide reductase family protein [Bacteroidota bacterium]
MKYLPICLLLGMLSLFSCQNESIESVAALSPTSIVFTGQVDSAEVEIIRCNTYLERMIDTLESGAFSFKIESEIPQIVLFDYNEVRWEVYGQPGDTVILNFRHDDPIKSKLITGNSVRENQLLQMIKEHFDPLEDPTNQLFPMNGAEFVQAIEKLQANTLAQFDSIIQVDQVDAAFVNIGQGYIDFSTAQAINQYPAYHAHAIKDLSYIADESILNAANQYKVERTDLLGVVSYIRYLDHYVLNQTMELHRNNPNLMAKDRGFLYSLMQVLEEQFTTEAVTDHLKFTRFKSLLNMSSPQGREEWIEDFIANTNNPFYKKEISQLYKDWAPLMPGKPAPKFEYPDVDSNLYALEDFKGKYVYIDMWATWCRPCLAEQPALERLINRYKNNDKIVFLGISIDEKKTSWRRMVTNKGMKGIQLIADGAWESTITKAYRIQGIPRFILIDDEGNIIDVDAKRPSDPGLVNELDALI